MRLAIKVVCVAVTLCLLGGAVAIGAGVPLSPARIAKGLSDAAKNLDIAEDNTAAAARDTEALATIDRNVSSQLSTSRRLLGIQLRIEEASRRGGGLAKSLVRRVGGVSRALGSLEGRVRGLTGLSARVTGSTRVADRSATVLSESLQRLMGRFRVVTRESRELNRKARGFEELRP